MSVRRRVLGPPVPKMPCGLLEIMDGLARDVLKNNPENIYEFCARHMQTLLEIRDGRVIKPLLSLDEKIENAQKRVRQRAEQRQRAYDNMINGETNKQKQDLSGDVNPVTKEDLENSEEKQPTNDSINSQPEAKEEVVIAAEELDKQAELTSDVKNETNSETDVLNEVNKENLDEKIDNGDEKDEEILTAVNCDENNKSNLLKENEVITDEGTRDNKTNNSLENNLTGENETVAPTTDVSNVNDVTELSEDAAVEIVSNNTDEKNLSEKGSSEEYSDIVHIGIVQNDEETELKEVEAIPNDLGDEIEPTEVIEKVVSPSNDGQEDNNDAINVDTEPSEKQEDPPSTNTSLNSNSTEIIITDTGTDDNLPKKLPDDLSEVEKSQDERILSVIVSSNGTESDSMQDSDTAQTNEQNPVLIIVPESQNDSNQKQEEVMDIERVPELAHDNDKTNNSSMDLETAAITIQKVFRSFLFKTKTASYDDSTTVDINLLTEDKEKEDEVVNIKDRRPLGLSRMDTVLQTVNEEKSLSLSTDDSSTLSSAATVIQAHVRGFLVRNKLNLNKTISSNSLIDSDAPSIPSLEADSDNIKSKTVLNIHIVPEGGHFVSRDESILTSMDLSLDSSPPSSVNLHPLGYDKSERRKQLKREDAIQSVSPPSNNSGKLSEDHDSVKEVLSNETNVDMGPVNGIDTKSIEIHDVIVKNEEKITIDSNIEIPISDAVSDEMDVVTPFVEGRSSRESDTSTKLLHSGEFHDIVVPTKVTRSDTSVVRGE